MSANGDEEEPPENEEETETDLPDDWDEMTDEERQEWWDEYEADEEDEDDDNIQIDIEPSDSTDRETGTYAVSGPPFGVEDELEQVGTNSPSVSVAGIWLDGAYQYRRTGEGHESQYLREIASGGGGGEADEYGGQPIEDEEVAGDEDGESSGGSEEYGGEEPPETVVIQAHCDHPTFEELRDLREEDTTFEVDLPDETLEDMELINVSFELRGEQPYNYDIEVEVREWREYEVEDFGEGEGTGPEEYGGSPEDLVEESGTPEDPEEIVTEEGEVRPTSVGSGEGLRNLAIDTTEPGSAAPIDADGDGWFIRDVGVDGSPGDYPAIRASAPDGSTGRIEDVYLSGNDTISDGGELGGEEYDVITVSGYQLFHIDDGETFSNVIFDQTAPGAAAQIVARNVTNWTIENVGWRGPMSGDARAITCGDTGGGESVVRNVYLGDGTDSNSGRRPGLGIWVDPRHNGHIEFQQINVQGARDNGIYASAPGNNSNGRRGSIAIRNCYGKNNRVAHFRLAGGVVENCVAVNDGSPAGRNIWVWPHRGGETTEIRNCHFICGGYPHGYDFGQSGQTTHATVENTRYAPSSSTRFKGNTQVNETNVGHNPQDFVPSGCPTSPEEAASGGGVDGPGGGGGEAKPDWPDPPGYDGPLPPPAIYVDPDNHSGNIIIDNVHVRGYDGGGIYADMSDTNGNLDIRNVYCRDNGEFNIHVGKTDD